MVQQFNNRKVETLTIVWDTVGPDESKVANTVLPIVATVVTSFRLFQRMRQGRLWLDDAWAMLAMVFVISLMVTDWLYLRDYGNAVGFLPEFGVSLILQ